MKRKHRREIIFFIGKIDLDLERKSKRKIPINWPFPIYYNFPVKHFLINLEIECVVCHVWHLIALHGWKWKWKRIYRIHYKVCLSVGLLIPAIIFYCSVWKLFGFGLFSVVVQYQDPVLCLLLWWIIIGA